MLGSTTFFTLLSALAIVEAFPSVTTRADTTFTTSLTFYNGTCTADNVVVRKEWRNLSDEEKQAFIDADIIDLPGTTTAFTDLQAIYQQGTNTSDGDILHRVGQFLPWHRYFVAAHATALKDYCNYTGTFPWWDELRDANTGNAFQSNMWDSELGFRGNSSASDLCLRDGPFANRTIYIGPLETLSPEGYCFKRQWNEAIMQINSTSTVVDYCNAHTTYEDYWMCNFNGPHVAGHAGFGGNNGLMGDIDNSPGDPIFFFYHAYVDRMWWQWQQQNASIRLTEIAGYTTQAIYAPATEWVNTTLEYELSSWGFVPNFAIAEVMNVQGGYLCYAYDY